MPTTVRRRSIVIGSAWSVPTIIIASPAPALAASLPLCSTLTQRTLDYGTVAGVTWSSTAGSPVSMTGTNGWYDSSGTLLSAKYQSNSTPSMLTSIANRGNLQPIYGTTATFLNLNNWLNNPNNSNPTPISAAYQLVKITFSQPVFGLNFYITDIDSATSTYIDNVSFSSSPAASPTLTLQPISPGSSTVAMQNVGGVIQPNTGTPGANGSETGSGASAVVTGTQWASIYDATPTGLTGDNGNVFVKYPSTSSVTSVTVRYFSQQFFTSQQIFISPMRFYTSACL